MLGLLRLLLASVLVTAVTAPLVPVPSLAGPGCACARRCCCRPSGGDEPCRLSRPCGEAGGEATPAAPGTTRPALLDAIAPEVVVPVCDAATPSTPLGRPAAADDPPPIPPPRVSTGR